MEIVNAYELVGSYRGAAELYGTTHKTVKRAIERRVVAGNTPAVQALIAERVRGPAINGTEVSFRTDD